MIDINFYSSLLCNILQCYLFSADYVGFIKKIMKLMQHKYPSIKKLEVELRQLEEPITLPSRPCKYLNRYFFFVKYYRNKLHIKCTKFNPTYIFILKL